MASQASVKQSSYHLMHGWHSKVPFDTAEVQRNRQEELPPTDIQRQPQKPHHSKKRLQEAEEHESPIEVSSAPPSEGSEYDQALEQ